MIPYELHVDELYTQMLILGFGPTVQSSGSRGAAWTHQRHAGENKTAGYGDEAEIAGLAREVVRGESLCCAGSEEKA